MLTDRVAKRCPSCHSKLRRRSAPIVLGETSRLELQSTLPLDRQSRTRKEAGGYWNPERPTPVVEKRARRRDVDRNAEPVTAAYVPAPVAAPEPEPEAIIVFEPDPVVVPEPEPVVVEAEVEAELEPYPFFETDEETLPSFLDLALAEHVRTEAHAPAALDLPAGPELELPELPAATTISASELDEGLDGDVNAVVDALHRKARGGVATVDVPPAPLFEPVEAPERSLPEMAPAGNRRRWARRGDEN